MTFWLSAALLWVSHTSAQWACPNTQHIITGVSVDLEWNWIDVDGELDDFELVTFIGFMLHIQNKKRICSNKVVWYIIVRAIQKRLCVA